jgi:hypothetical protein
VGSPGVCNKVEDLAVASKLQRRITDHTGARTLALIVFQSDYQAVPLNILNIILYLVLTGGILREMYMDSRSKDAVAKDRKYSCESCG